jgi:YegS/Rv2252/BmrU family lipid kinase
MNGPFCLVVNPAAGHGRALRVLRATTALLDASAASYEVATSDSLDHARDLAARAAQQGNVVVAVGGDGMAGALAAVAAREGGRFAIVPAGNGNDLARGLGIPFQPTAAVPVLTNGRERKVDLIAVEQAGQPETVVAGSVYLGIPSVAGEIANRTRWLRGPALYPVAGLRAVAGWKPAGFKVEIRGQDAQPEVHEYSGYAIVVANASYFGAGMQVAPHAQADDGLLDVLTMRHAPRLVFLRVLTKIRNGSHLSLPQIGSAAGTEVVITVDRDLPAAADGETLPGAAPLRAGTPLRLRALPGVLRVLVPSGA